MDVQDSDEPLNLLDKHKRGSHVVENSRTQGRLLKKRNDYIPKDSRSINEVLPGSQDLNSLPSLTNQFDSMGNLVMYNLYPSQSKLQITNKYTSKLSQYDIIDSESSPKVPHFISNVETSKIQDEEGMSSNYDMKKYRK